MKNKFLISATLLALCTLQVSAQSRILNILETNPDTRTAAMGNVTLGNTDQHHLYVNPAALVFSAQTLGVDLSVEGYPLTEAGRLMQYNLSAGYKLNPNNAVFLGARYSGGQRIASANGDIRPNEWTLDLGYAFGVTREIVVYGSGSFAQSNIGTRANALTFSVGAAYQKEITVATYPTLLTLGARLLDAGTAVKFDNTKLPHSLPTSVAVGGDWSIGFSKEHQLTYALSGRYFVPKGTTQLFLNTGLEYIFHNMVAARVGYERGQRGVKNLTMGLGGRYSHVKVDVAYRHSLNPAVGINTLMVGVGFDL